MLVVVFHGCRLGERGSGGDRVLRFEAVVATYTRTKVQLLLYSWAIGGWGSVVERWLLRGNMGIAASSLVS